MSKALAKPRFGLDSTSQVDAEAHRRIGSTFAMRYVSRYTPKTITKAEADYYRSHGIDLGLVFEDGAANAVLGHGQGQADAAVARDQARAAGVPLGRPIYFAVDFDTAGNPQRTDAYFEGARVILGEAVGVYGGFEVVSHQMNRGIKWGWQTYAWSRGQWDRRAQIRQDSNGHTVGGVGVDFNHAYYEDFGQASYLPPKPADALQYHRFYAERFAWRGRLLPNERDLVKLYDRLRVHGVRNRKKLKPVREALALSAERIAAIVLSEPKAWGYYNWGACDRGWRYQQLVHRAQGKRFA